MCSEFNIINYYFNRARKINQNVILGIGDDCALISISENNWLAVSTDTLVSGTHFLPNTNPLDLGHKIIAINLSDMSAMGAEPCWASLAITVPKLDKNWLRDFSDSLFHQLEKYNIQLIGGDTTRGPLSLTLTVQGLIPTGCAITRSGARAGDWIYLTGTLGDSAAGLAILQKRLKVNDKKDNSYLLSRHLRPQPRILQGKALRGIASAAIDISDGIIADLKHILTCSDCGARVDLENIPISSELLRCVAPDQALKLALSGGEDYELCFTVPEINRKKMQVALKKTGVIFTCIGQILPYKEGLQLINKHGTVNCNWHGYDHFKPVKC